MPLRKKPVYLHVVEPHETATVCSWCGLNVPTKTQQDIHDRWHRAVGVVPLKAESADDV